MTKLEIIRQCIKNDLAAIDELTEHVKQLKLQEAVAIFEQEAEEELKEDFPI